MLIKTAAGRLLKLGACSAVAACGALRLYRRFRPGKKLQILMYHKITSGSDPLGLTISPDLFARQLQYLTEQYTIISLAEAVYRLESGAIDRDFVVITFDDGYRDNYSVAYPILQRFKAPATIFVTVDAVESGTFGWHRFDSAILGTKRSELDLSGSGLGRYDLTGRRKRERAVVELHRALKKLPDAKRQAVIAQVLAEHGDPGAVERSMLCWDEVREMQGSGLVTIGAHTLSHPILTRIPHDSALAEIRDGKSRLEQETGAPVEFFAYPNGGRDDFDEEIVAMVKACGYRAACSTISAEHFDKMDRFCLPRTDVTEGICSGFDGCFSRNLFSVKVSGMLDGILFRS